MAKLTNLKPRLGAMGTRLSVPSPTTERDRFHARDAASPWRAWYKTARWQKLRMRVIIRDRYTCQKTGEVLIGKHPAPNSPVVDHKVPHRGDERLFWDEANLQTISKAYHDSEKQRQEREMPAGVWY